MVEWWWAAKDRPIPEKEKEMAENLFSPEGLQEILSKITDIDSQLAAASGNETQQRAAAIERIVAANSDQVNKTVDKLIEAIAKLDPAVIVGVLDRLDTAATEKFAGQVDELVNAEVATSKTEGGIDPEALKGTRKELVADFDSLKRLLIKALPEGSEPATVVAGLEVPRRRGGGGGSGSGRPKSGKNKEGYRYAIDGKDRPNSQNTLSSVAFYATEKCPTNDGRERWTTEEFRAFLADNGVKLGEDEEFSVTLPNDKVVSGKREIFEDDDEPGSDDEPGDGADPKETPTETPASA